MQFIIFFSIWVSLLALTYFYVGRRIISHSGVTKRRRRIYWGVLLLLFLLPQCAFFLLVGGFESTWLDLLSWGGYLILGVFSLTATMLFMRDLWIGLWRIVQRLFARKKISFLSKKKTDYERRRLLLHSTNMGVLGLATVVTGYGAYESHRAAHIDEIAVPIRGLPDEFDGFRIIQISDIHVGPTIKRRFVEGIVQQVNELKGDLIAFTGDLADGSVAWLKEDVAPLQDLVAPQGSFFVTGNHEYYSGVEQWTREATRLGFSVLMNEHAIISRNGSSIVIAGITDYTAGQFTPTDASDPIKALRDAPKNIPKILLAHQPRSIYEVVEAGCQVQLSGHTHGGQFFPWNHLATFGQPYISGLHHHEDMWVYVNRGTGYWGPPLRLGTPPEISVLTLKKA